jgi:hypothetical protein
VLGSLFFLQSKTVIFLTEEQQSKLAERGWTRERIEETYQEHEGSKRKIWTPERINAVFQKHEETTPERLEADINQVSSEAIRLIRKKTKKSPTYLPHQQQDKENNDRPSIFDLAFLNSEEMVKMLSGYHKQRW